MGVSRNISGELLQVERHGYVFAWPVETKTTIEKGSIMGRKSSFRLR
jgi:hypothetical protein